MGPAVGLPYYKKKLEGCKLTLSAYESRCLVLLEKIGLCHKASGRFAKAEPLFWRIANILLAGDYTMPEREKAVSDLMDILREQGIHEESLTLRLRLVRFYEEAAFSDLERLAMACDRTAAF